MKPFINGMGIVAATGRGVDSLRSSLQTGWQPPAMVTLPAGRDLSVYSLPHGLLEDKSFGRKIRRDRKSTRLNSSH